MKIEKEKKMVKDIRTTISHLTIFTAIRLYLGGNATMAAVAAAAVVQLLD